MKDVRVWYWLDEPNFGDMLNANICKDIFDVNAIPVGPEECEAAFIGSVLDDFLYPEVFINKKHKKLLNEQVVNVWGSGFICDKNQFIKRPCGLPERYFRKVKVHAVRGLLSKKRLEKITHANLHDVVIGDPGLLADRLLKSVPEKKYKLGIIPHHSELKDDLWKCFSKIPGAIIIRVDESVQDTLQKIAQCETIASSAMHGLIVADALHIPNIRLIASNKLIGGDYKFNDYYSAYGMNDHEKLDITKQEIPKDFPNYIKNHYKIKSQDVERIKNNLYDSFPYKKV